MPISFLSPELSKWDVLGGDGGPAPPELLVLPFFVDERPLRGAAGLVDWRLCGRLSKLLLAGKVAGGLGETTLFPVGRLPFRKVLLFGMGDSERFDEEIYRDAVKTIRHVVKRLGVKRFALPLPGRTTGQINARRALDIWLGEADRESEVWVVEPQAVQKDMSEMLGKSGRR
jgi:hypothetical protein